MFYDIKNVFVLFNERKNIFTFAPSGSVFGLGDEWMNVWMTNPNIQGTYLEPCEEMFKSARKILPSTYEHISFVTLVPAIGWVTLQEFHDFKKVYSSELSTTMKLGEAFLQFFSHRFPNGWLEVSQEQDDRVAEKKILKFCY